MAAPRIELKETWSKKTSSCHPRRRLTGLLGKVSLMLGSVVILGLVACEPGSNAHDGAGSSSSSLESAERQRSEMTVPPDTVASTTTVTVVPSTAAPLVAGTSVAVVNVIDGDTIAVAGGQKVRLIGIDTPERGQCGYTEAAFTLAALINGRPVDLIPGARDDTDRYGRLLRYVEVDGVDLNLKMIESGRAIARYDSRDGYGRHARQDIYIAADAASPSTNNCAPPPTHTSTVPSAPAGTAAPEDTTRSSGGAKDLDPRFGTCKEAKGRGYGPYTRGVDPEYDWYRDGDRDGIVCE